MFKHWQLYMRLLFVVFVYNKSRYKTENMNIQIWNLLWNMNMIHMSWNTCIIFAYSIIHLNRLYHSLHSINLILHIDDASAKRWINLARIVCISNHHQMAFLVLLFLKQINHTYYYISYPMTFLMVQKSANQFVIFTGDHTYLALC